eukprot:EG_transcript_5171
MNKELLDKAKAAQGGVQDACAQLKAAAAAVLQARKDGHAHPEALKAGMTKGALALIDLKRLNREVHLLADEHEKAVQPRRAVVDEAHVQLQNFLYEQQQYQSAINACAKFVSRHKDIPLLPLEEYLEQHPWDKQADAHTLLLHRLNHELEERQRGEEVLARLREEKAQVKDSKKSSERFLEGLRDSLKGVKESTKPLQDYLHVQPKERQKENRKAALLPAPLYVLFQKWAALSTSNAKEGLTVKINGHKSNVDAFNAATQKRMADEGMTLEDGPPELKRRRLAEAGGAAAANLFDVHPLSVEVGFDLKEGPLETGVTLRFFFVPLLNHIAVELAVSRKSSVPASWISNVTVLRHLIPDDDGRTPPNPATAYPAMDQLPSADPSRLPFKWAQWLAGYDFMFPLPVAQAAPLDVCRPVGQQFNCRHRQGTGRVFRAIKARLLARLALCRQVEWLRKRQFGNCGLAVDPGRWQQLDPVKFTVFEELSAATLPDGAPALKAFKAVFQAEHYTFHATVYVPEDYPETASLITLSCTAQPASTSKVPDTLKDKVDRGALDLLRTCAHERPTLNGLKHVEYEVNYNLQPHCSAPVAADRYILVRQLQLLMRCLDLLLHVETGKTDRVCLRPQRGRDRALPFQWSATLKMFEH